MTKVRYLGKSPIKLEGRHNVSLDGQTSFTDRVVEGAVVEVTDELAAELLAVEPDTIRVKVRGRLRGQKMPEPDDDGIRRIEAPNPRAGRRIRPDWEAVAGGASTKPKAKASVTDAPAEGGD